MIMVSGKSSLMVGVHHQRWCSPPGNTSADAHGFLFQHSRKCQEAHITKLALACQILLLTIYRYEAKIKDFKTGENESEPYTARTCGVRTGYLAGLSSSWRETQTPRKWPRALCPSLGPTPPPTSRPPKQSFATPPPAGPE